MTQPPLYTVAILAGGLATRLRPITEKIPKALVEVAGQPFIVRQLAYLKSQGVTRVVLCISYLGEQIERVVGDGSQLGLEVLYSADGPQLLGTGGALRKALPLLGECFFVLYGDSFLPCDFSAVQQAFATSGQPALMTVLRNQNQWDKSNVLFEGDRIVEYNKHQPHVRMHYIDYGLGVLARSVLEGVGEDEVCDLAEIYHRLAERQALAGYEIHERFYEIGSHGGLKETEDYFYRKETI